MWFLRQRHMRNRVCGGGEEGDKPGIRVVRRPIFEKK
jgi:hypothetical protein